MTSSFTNQLLATQSLDVLNDLAPHLDTIEFGQQFSFYQDGEIPEHVYFIDAGLASLLTTLSDGYAVESAVIGMEGAVGLLTPGIPASGTVVGQIPGRARRIGIERLYEIAARNPALDERLSSYRQFQSDEARQSTVCIARHKAEPRLCRWLLRCQDRVGPRLDLIQKNLAHMLGSRRSTVSSTAAGLERAGLITYSRGSITILDRVGLEARSCECYAAMRRRAQDFGLPPPECGPSE